MTELIRILVVDDEVDLLASLCEALDRNGYQATGFTSGADALKTLQEQDFDLLVLDLMMPQMNGIELLKEALQIDPQAIGIIMTGYGTLQTAVEAMNVGAFDYILKPFKLHKLLPVLSRAAEMRRLKNENLQLRESMAVYDLSLAVSSTLNTNVILDRIADAVLNQCGADEMSVMLPTNTGELYVAFIRGKEREGLLGQRISAQKGIAGWVASNRKDLLLHGEVRDSRFAPVRPRPEIASSISMPLLVGGKCVGVLNVNSRKRGSFPPGKVKVLKILAGTAASALENASLYTALRESEERYRRIVETAIEGLWVLDGDCRTTFANKKMGEMLACPVAEMIGASVYDFVDPDWVAIMKEKIRLRRQGVTEQYEFKFRRRDGKELWALLSTNTVYDSSGQYTGSMAMVTDITERKQFEQEIVRLDRLNLVGEMAAGIAHEIRNPMTVVRGYLQLLQAKEEHAANRRRFAVMIEELDRANAIITEFLSLAKNAQVELQKQSLNDILSALLPLIQAEAMKTGVGLSMELGDIPDLDLDEKQIRQVVLNLVRNGIEAMPGKGVLTVKTGMNSNDEVVLSVTDQGAGIRPEVLNKIGTPFFSTKDQGTGLGLAVCYRIAERHHARIKIDTGQGGTTFSVCFQQGVDRPAARAGDLQQQLCKSG
jgi:PAS domain S-box-containing protein